MGKPINVSGGTLTAKDHAVINNVIIDSNGIAKNFGNTMNHRLDSVNEVAILDGFAMVQGRCYVIYSGDEERMIIKNGSQGMKRRDLIVIEFDNSLEKLELKVLEGVEDASNPSDPELVQEDTLNGGNLYQMPLYRVVIDGLTVSVEDLRIYLKKLGSVEGTATPPQVLTGATFLSEASENVQIGTMPNIKATSVTLAPGNSYTIPLGYHNGKGKVTASGSAYELVYLGSGRGGYSAPAVIYCNNEYCSYTQSTAETGYTNVTFKKSFNLYYICTGSGQNSSNAAKFWKNGSQLQSVTAGGWLDQNGTGIANTDISSLRQGGTGCGWSTMAIYKLN